MDQGVVPHCVLRDVLIICCGSGNSFLGFGYARLKVSAMSRESSRCCC